MGRGQVVWEGTNLARLPTWAANRGGGDLTPASWNCLGLDLLAETCGGFASLTWCGWHHVKSRWTIWSARIFNMNLYLVHLIWQGCLLREEGNQKLGSQTLRDRDRFQGCFATTRRGRSLPLPYL